MAPTRSASSLCLFVALLCACQSRSAPPEALFGDLRGVREAALEASDLGPYLALSRSIILGPTPLALGIHDYPGSRVFLTAHLPGKDDLVTTATGPTLEAAVTSAAQSVRDAGDKRLSDAVRLQLDVTIAASKTRFKKEIKLEAYEIGTFGYLLSQEGKAPGYILPGEIITGDHYRTGRKARLSYKEVAGIIASRAGVPKKEATSWDGYRFETLSVVESTPPGKVLSLYRGMVTHEALPNYPELFRACRAGADYLTGIVDDKGRYVYNYWAASDRYGQSYNMLRHCGTTYAILEAYEEFHDPRYLATAERALEYAKDRIHPKPDWVETRPEIKTFVHLIDEEKGKLSKTGGAGLALIAMTKHAGLTGSAENLETMRGLARFLMHMQEDNGHFLSYFKYLKDKDVTHKEVLYYPGEAILGLTRLYAMDPNPQWLETAKKAADYLIFTRDVEKTEANIEHDHWLSIALNELYRITRNDAYAGHAFKIARAIASKQASELDAPAPDFVGSFYKMPNSTPASVRLEAYAADIALARFIGKSDGDLIKSAMQVARFVRSQQFDEQNSFFLPNPAKAIGGVRESIVKNNIRIDYVQHALSGMLGLARALRDPDFGKTGVPGVMPIKPLEDLPQK